MIHIKQITLLLISIVAITACGGGDSVPSTDATYSIEGSITITDPESWIESQTIHIGLFLDDAITPSYSIDIDKPEEGEVTTFTFEGVEDKDYSCKVYVAESGIYQADIYQFSDLNITKDIDLSHTDITLLTYDRLQDQLFNQCLLCHGQSSGDLAAGLDLTEESSYSNLVDVQSTNSTLLRVASGSSAESFIIEVLNLDQLTFDHSASSLAKDSDIELLEMWIDEGAKDN